MEGTDEAGYTGSGLGGLHELMAQDTGAVSSGLALGPG